MALRNFLAILLTASAAGAAVWPDQFAGATRSAVKPVVLGNTALWTEFGLQESEQGVYEGAGKKFTATAHRLRDSTGAMAAYEWQHSDATPAVLHGNYILIFDGYAPQPIELARLYQALPRLDQSPLPSLPDYFPKENIVAGSKRYVVGPVSLQAFESRIAPSLAAFHLGAEAQLGTFRSPAGNLKLALFYYPTPQMARERETEFRKVAQAVVKRSGPLVAIVLAPPNADDAERLLSQVSYQASVTWSERVPSMRDNIGNLIINIFVLIGVLLGFAIVAGLAFGGVRAFIGGRTSQHEALTTLHLRDR